MSYVKAVLQRWYVETRRQDGIIDSDLIAPIIGLMIGMLLIVLGVNLGLSVVDSAATSGADAQMGSFTTAKSFNDLTPTVYYIVLLIAGVSVIGVSTYMGYRKMKGD